MKMISLYLFWYDTSISAKDTQDIACKADVIVQLKEINVNQ